MLIMTMSEETVYFDWWIDEGVIYMGGLTPIDNGGSEYSYWIIGYDNESTRNHLRYYVP